MRIGLALLGLLICGFSPLRADPPFHAGAMLITVQDAISFEALVAYPTDTPAESFRIRAFTVAASRNAPIASERAFPVVLFSHGNGRRGGTSLVHQDLLVSLARRGFIVIAPFHPSTPRPLQKRPGQVHKALDAVLADQRFAAPADRARIGMIGFSFGGAVALEVAGATPNYAHWSAYCRGRTDDPRACEGAPTGEVSSDLLSAPSADVLPLKALVLMEPFGSLFDSEALKSVQMPVLLYRAENSDLAAERNIFALARALPRPPRQETVAGAHFIFADPCPSALDAEAPAICRDAPGVDRKTIHQRIETEVGIFLRDNL